MWQQILRHDTTKISALYLVWRLTLLFFGFIALTLLPKVAAGELVIDSFNFWQSWANWDGGHFLGIAENGFVHTQQYAFFPLFPALIRLFSPLFLGNFLVSALVVTNLSALFATILFFKLARLDFSKEKSIQSLTYLLFFPTAFFLGVVYAEPIFILTSITAFYSLRKKNITACAFFAILATLTKPYGILITLPLIIEYFSSKKFKLRLEPQFFLLLTPIVVFIFYLIYLKSTTGDPFIFIKVQKDWARVATNPVVTLWVNYLSFFTTPVNLFYGIRLVEFLTVILVLAIVAFGWKILRFSYFVYVLLLLLTFVSTGNLTSFPRFILVLWPVFFVLATWGENFLFDFSYKLVGLSFLGLFTSLFLAGFFIS